MTLKTDINVPQAILTAVLIALLVLALFFCVAFVERDETGKVIGISKPKFNFFC